MGRWAAMSLRSSTTGTSTPVHLRFAGERIDSDFEVPVPPKANPDAYATGRASAGSQLANVLVDDVAINQHPMTVALASTTANGTLTFDSDGGFSMRSDTAFSGTDSFTYTATDAVFGLTSAPATVAITVDHRHRHRSNAERCVDVTALAPHIDSVDTRTRRCRRVAERPSRSRHSQQRWRRADRGVTAVVLNVTTTESQASGYVQVSPAGAPVLGSTSSVNLDHGLQTISNTVIVGVDASSRSSMFTQSTTHLVVDVFSYFTARRRLTRAGSSTIDPIRVLDTHAESGTDRKVRAARKRHASSDGRFPANAATVSHDADRRSGHGAGLRPGRPEQPRHRTRSIVEPQHRPDGETMANTVIVPLGAGGSVTLFTNADAHLVADVVGYFAGADAAAASTGLFVPVTPVRAANSRVTGNLSSPARRSAFPCPVVPECRRRRRVRSPATSPPPTRPRPGTFSSSRPGPRRRSARPRR